MAHIPFPRDVSRVAFAGDWHADTRYAARAIHWAAKQGTQVVVHTGDFGYRFTPGFLAELDRAAERAGLVVMFVDGNHEDFDFLLAQPVSDDGVRRLTSRVWHLPRGLRWRWSDLTFLALGGATSLDREWRVPGAEWWYQEALRPSDVESALRGGLVDVMITHDSPAGVQVPGTAGNPLGFPQQALDEAYLHRRALADVVEAVRPGWLWHGHFHVRYTAELTLPDGTVCQVRGLGMNGSEFADNMDVVNLAELGVSRRTQPSAG